jgi:hypothetical protein
METMKNIERTGIEPYFLPIYVPEAPQRWIEEMIKNPNISMTRSGDDFVYNDYDKDADWQVIYVARIYAQVRARSAAKK